MRTIERRRSTPRITTRRERVAAPRTLEFYKGVACENCGQPFEEHETCTGRSLCGNGHGWRSFNPVRRKWTVIR